jgi:Zn finger protein HypA/HybF involved in hydrogenase expression
MEGTSIHQCILEAARRFISEVEAQQEGDSYLVIGVHCDEDRGTKQMQWDVVHRGTLAEAARRYFERALLTLRCTHCEGIFEITEGMENCPLCGSDCLTVAEREGPFP